MGFLLLHFVSVFVVMDYVCVCKSVGSIGHGGINGEFSANLELGGVGDPVEGHQLLCPHAIALGDDGRAFATADHMGFGFPENR